MVLNTIIPAKNDIYFRKGKHWHSGFSGFTDEAGINPSLSYFKELFDNGELSVMNNVGYPNPDKSHFRSMDIWQSASRSDEFLDTGWLGRFLDEECYRCEHPTQALEVDDMLSLALKRENNKAFAFKDPKDCIRPARKNISNPCMIIITMMKRFPIFIRL
jgi:hypothetical protein